MRKNTKQVRPKPGRKTDKTRGGKTTSAREGGKELRPPAKDSLADALGSKVMYEALMAATALGQSVPEFVCEAVSAGVRAVQDDLEAAARGTVSGAVQQGGAAGAVPSQEALAFLARRLEVAYNKLPTELQVNLPGLGLATWSHGALLERMAAAIHYGAGEPMRSLVLCRCGSTWETVELAEVLCVAEELLEKDASKDERGLRFSLNESQGLSSHRWVNGSALLVHFAFVVMQHAETISREVLPRMSHLPDAAWLAEALVIAETVVNKAGVAVDAGTVAQPTALQRQAWAFAARLWLEWPVDKGFGQLREATPRAARLVGMEAGKGVEPVAPSSRPRAG